ncbi:hypothetical protein DICA2_D17128 [Diutina catenulata]
MARVKTVDKALAQFHNLQEWADYIAALARLQKALQGHENALGDSAVDTASTLARCLSSELPSGVHQKALGVYQQIFASLSDTSLNAQLQMWLPGVFPVLTYGASAVKPVALAVVRDQVMPRLSKQSLELVAFPLLNCLLSGLDDETSEFFNSFHGAIETFKKLLADDTVFWTQFVMVVVRSGDRRTGAWRWVARHLPKLGACKHTGTAFGLSEKGVTGGVGASTTEENTGSENRENSGNGGKTGDFGGKTGDLDAETSGSDAKTSDSGSETTSSDRSDSKTTLSDPKTTDSDAKTTVSDAKTTSYDPKTDSTSPSPCTETRHLSSEAVAVLSAENGGLIVRMFVAALGDSDIVVVRGFFDVLLTHMPLCTTPGNLSERDRVLLLMACCRVTLRRDMSLNRRLYTYLLGSQGGSRYFREYGAPPVVDGLLAMIQSHPGDAVRICLALAMDKWDISHVVVPRVFRPILGVFVAQVGPPRARKSSVASLNGSAPVVTPENKVVTACHGFFDAIDPSFMWQQLVSGPVDTARVILAHWQFPRPASIDPALVAVALLGSVDSELDVVAQLVAMCGRRDHPPAVSEPVATASEAAATVARYYDAKTADHNTPEPFSDDEVAVLLLQGARDRFNSDPEASAAFLLEVCSLTDQRLGPGLDVEALCARSARAVLRVLPVVDPPVPGALLRTMIAELPSALVPRLLDYFSGYQVEAGLFLALQAEPSDARRFERFEGWWRGFADSPSVVARPLQLVVDSLPHLEAVNCLRKILRSHTRHQLVAVLVGAANVHDYGRWQYHFDSVEAVVTGVPGAREAFGEGDEPAKWVVVAQVEALLKEGEQMVARGADADYVSALTSGLRVLSLLLSGSEAQFGEFVARFLVATSKFSGDYQYCQAQCLEVLEGFASLHAVSDALVDFILDGLGQATSRLVVEKWVSVLVGSVHTLGETSFFFAVVPYVDALIAKLTDPAMVEPVFKGVSDLLSIVHSYYRAQQGVAGAQPSPASSQSFLGKVFTIETPATESEGRQRQAAIATAFHTATTAAVRLWNHDDASKETRFHVKRVLTRLLALEPRLVLEVMVGSADNVRLVTILDGGRHAVVPQLYELVASAPSARVRDASAQFLVDYFDFSVDSDAMLDLWPSTHAYLKEAANSKTCLAASLRLCVEVSTRSRAPSAELAEIASKLVSLLSQQMAASPDSFGADIAQLVSVAPSLPQVLAHDNDKLVAVANSLVYNVVAPEFKQHKGSLAQFSPSVVALLEQLPSLTPAPVKPWKTAVADLFFAQSFWEAAPQFQPVVATWIASDDDRFKELIAKAAPATSSISLWGEGLSAETKEKVQALKRLAYLVMISPDNHFLPHLAAIFEQLSAESAAKSPPEYLTYASLLVRAIVVKFDQLHLLPRWTFIIEMVMAPLRELAHGDPVKEPLSPAKCQLVLFTCKLLDQLLLLGLDEFSLAEWMFIGNRGVIVEINKSKCLPFDGTTAVAIDNDYSHPLRPLLQGLSSIKTVSVLRSFFNSLPLVHYERVYSVQSVDVDAVKADITSDIVA